MSRWPSLFRLLGRTSCEWPESQSLLALTWFFLCFLCLYFWVTIVLTDVEVPLSQKYPMYSSPQLLSGSPLSSSMGYFDFESLNFQRSQPYLLEAAWGLLIVL